MILNLSFQLAKPFFPIDYRPIFVSSIKTVMCKYYPQSFEELYGNNRPTMKSYTFSVALPSPVFSEKNILLGRDKLKLSLSAFDDSEFLMLYNAFQKSRNLNFPLPEGNSMQLISVNIRPIPRLKGSSAVIKFLSPIVVRDHTPGKFDHYYTFEDQDFNSCLQRTTSRMLGYDAPISLEPISPKKTVVRAFGTNIRTSMGIYRLSAAPEVLNVLQNGGLGSRRSEGFGMFALIKG